MSICLVCFEPVVKIGWWAVLTMEQSPLCERCWEGLEKIAGPTCSGCGRMLEVESLCGDCEKWRQIPDWSRFTVINRSVFTYNKGMKDIFNQFKFRGDVELVKAFQKELKCLFRREFSKVDIISPIPLSSVSLYERGFNQSEVIAKLITKDITHLLTKKHVPKQSKKNRLERVSRNNSFEVLPNCAVLEKHILLVDDIYTTGSTIRHAGKLLLERGAKKISALTLIRS